MRKRPSVDVLGILPNDLLKVLLSDLDGTYAIPYVLVGHISVFKAPNKGHDFLFHSVPLEKNPGGIGDGRESFPNHYESEGSCHRNVRKRSVRPRVSGRDRCATQRRFSELRRGHLPVIQSRSV